MNGSRASRCGFHAYLTLDFEWNFKAICKKYDIVYLIDEVQTGGGPTGKWDHKTILVRYYNELSECGAMNGLTSLRLQTSSPSARRCWPGGCTTRRTSDLARLGGYSTPGLETRARSAVTLVASVLDWTSTLLSSFSWMPCWRRSRGTNCWRTPWRQARSWCLVWRTCRWGTLSTSKTPGAEVWITSYYSNCKMVFRDILCHWLRYWS